MARKTQRRNVRPAVSSPDDRLLIIPDTHAPFHDARAWDVMMRFARAWKPTRIRHLGDLNDFYSVSSHDKDPRRALTLEDETKVTRDLLDDLGNLKVTDKVLHKGNHEDRLDRYLMRQAPALLGVVSLDKLLDLRERGWKSLPYGDHFRTGNLFSVHDVGRSGQQATHQTAVAVGHNIVFGHTHRMQMEYFGTALGERYVAATCGWLGNVEEATYVSRIVRASWQLGFATAVMDKKGDFQLTLRPIVDYKVITDV